MSHFLVRKNVDGIVIAYSFFAEIAEPTAREKLAISAIALVDLKDIFDVLNQKKDLAEFFSELIKNVKLYENPKPVVNIRNLKDLDCSLYV